MRSFERPDESQNEEGSKLIKLSLAMIRGGSCLLSEHGAVAENLGWCFLAGSGGHVGDCLCLPLQGCHPGLCAARMETSASATATDKKEVKGGILEGLAFPDPGRKASALAVATAAAAAAVAAQGGTCCSMHLAGEGAVFHESI